MKRRSFTGAVYEAMMECHETVPAVVVSWFPRVARTKYSWAVHAGFMGSGYNNAHDRATYGCVWLRRPGRVLAERVQDL